jgi:transposase
VGRLQPMVPKPRRGPQSTRGDRLFIDAVVYRAKTGVPWRDLPERFGPWKSVYNRFASWARMGHWETIFRALQDEFDQVGSIVDGSTVRAHQEAAGGKGGSDAMLWAAVEEVFQPSSTPSSTPKPVPSTSRSRARARARGPLGGRGPRPTKPGTALASTRSFHRMNGRKRRAQIGNSGILALKNAL